MFDESSFKVVWKHFVKFFGSAGWITAPALAGCAHAGLATIRTPEEVNAVALIGHVIRNRGVDSLIQPRSTASEQASRLWNKGFASPHRSKAIRWKAFLARAESLQPRRPLWLV